MSHPPIHQLFDVPAAPATGETFTPLVQHRDVMLEKIDSRGAASPEGFWYDQPRDEWVLLARGEAVLRFDHGAPVTLTAGNHVLIPARCKHRVESTSLDAVWLALHVGA